MDPPPACVDDAAAAETLSSDFSKPSSPRLSATVPTDGSGDPRANSEAILARTSAMSRVFIECSGGGCSGQTLHELVEERLSLVEGLYFQPLVAAVEAD